VLAGELTSTAARWAESLRADEANGSNGTE
jgi:hypothetical protein